MGLTPLQNFVYGILTLFDELFQALRLSCAVTFADRQINRDVPQPRTCNACRLSHTCGLASSAFARHYLRNHMLFSLPVGTEMFHFPTFPLPVLYLQTGVTSSHIAAGRVSPFGNPRITARLSTPRGLSQITTSFFGSRCQGIHRSLFRTCKQNKITYTQHPPQKQDRHCMRP